jgi:hypothetical protein
VLVTLGSSLLAAWLSSSQRSAGPCVVASGPAKLPDIPETSGLAVSRRSPGLLWSHNDSGNAAVLFALDSGGALRGRVRVPRVHPGLGRYFSRPLSAGRLPLHRGHRRQRPRPPADQDYRVPEPAPGDAETAPPEVFTATYVDGPHNAEALFVVDADLFIVTKDRAGFLYRATLPPSGSRLIFQRAGQLGIAMVTDAETSRDGTSIVVRTPGEVVLFRTTDVIGGTYTPVHRIAIGGLREPQGEGVALDGEMLYLSSEGGRDGAAGWFMSLRCRWPGVTVNEAAGAPPPTR